jgi:DNA-binding NtrC family response regulator
MPPVAPSLVDLLPALDAAPYGVASLRYSAVYLIDGDRSAYAAAASGVDLAQVCLRHFTTAAEALRVPKFEAPMLYLVNAALADMSGFDLYAMLQERWPQVPGYLISDSYNTADEIRARCAGSTLYFCKPLSEGWLASVLEGIGLEGMVLEGSLPAEELAMSTEPATATLPTMTTQPSTQPALLWKRPAVRRTPHHRRPQ